MDAFRVLLLSTVLGAFGSSVVFASDRPGSAPFFCLEFFEQANGSSERLFEAYARALDQYRSEVGEVRFLEAVLEGIDSGNPYRFGRANTQSPTEIFLGKFAGASSSHEEFDTRVRDYLRKMAGASEEAARTVKRAVESAKEIETYVEKIPPPYEKLAQIKIRDDLSQSAQAAYTGELVIRDLRSRAIVSEIRVDGKLNDFQMNQDWTKAAILSRTGIVTIWDVKTGRMEAEFHPSASDLSESQKQSRLFVDASFTHAVSGRAGESNYHWDLVKRAEIQKFADRNFEMADSRLERAIASDAKGSRRFLIDLLSGEETQLVSPSGYVGVFKGANTDLTRAVSWDVSKFRLWDLTEKKIIFTYQGPAGRHISSTRFSKDFKWVVAGDDDGFAALIDLESKREVRTWVFPKSQGDGRVTSFAVNSDRTKVALGMGSGRVEIFDIASGKSLGIANVGGFVRTFDVTEDFSRAILSDFEGALYFMDLAGIEGRG